MKSIYLNFFLLLCSCSSLVSCKDERSLNITVWKGAEGEIVRDLNDSQEEWLSCSDPKFLDFRCTPKADMTKVIRMARKYCDTSKLKPEELKELNSAFRSLETMKNYPQ